MPAENRAAFVPRHPDRLWWLGVLATAFALRVYMLGGQSLWNDEGTSVALASRSLEAIADGAAKDIHPPLYYFLLHFWMPLSGESEYAVRFLSVIAGVLLVAFTFRLAQELFGREVALVAGLLSALSPFQIYYSQETRMYIWVALWSAVSVWAMVRIISSPSPLPPPSPAKQEREGEGSKGDWGDTPHAPPSGALPLNPKKLAWLLYVAATVAALYTHYFAPAVIVAENLAFLVWLVLTWRGVRRSTADRGPRAAVRQALVVWIAAQLLIGLAFLPWYLYAGNQLAAWPSISEPFDLPTLLWRVLNVFSIGLSLEGTTATITALLLGVLLVIGLVPAREARTNWRTALLGLWLIVPVGIMYIVSLSRPAYNAKFLLLATPPFFILVARGLANLCARVLAGLGPAWRQASLYSVLAVAVLTTVGFLPSIYNYFTDSRYARDDYRGIMQYVDAHAQAGDGLLIDAPGQSEVVRYYERGDERLFPLPIGRPADPVQTRAAVDEMLTQVRRLYAIYWATEQADPERIIEARLAEKAFKARDEWHGNIRLAIYGIAPSARQPIQSVDAELGGEIMLSGYQLDADEMQAGDLLTLTLHWRAEQVPSARYKVFVHMLDAQDHVVGQRDGEPVGDLRLTTTWRAGETIADNYGILIEPETPPGEYRVEVGMYRADNGARLPILGKNGQALGDALIISQVRIK